MENKQKNDTPCWGPMTTILFSGAISMFGLLATSLALGIWSAFRDPASGQGLIGINHLCMLLVIPVAALKKGSCVKDYFNLKIPQRRLALIWTLAFVTFIFLLDMVFTALGRQEAALEAMRPLWDACDPMLKPLFVMSVVVFAPLGEEFLFRGFLMEGLRRSVVGAPVAIILSSLFWTLMHLQYAIPELIALFLMGILLGTIRLKTGSMWTVIGLHSLNNIISMVALWLI